MLIEYPLDSDLEARHAEGADREDPRPVSLRRRGQAGPAGQLVVEEERIDASRLALTNLDDNTIQVFMRAKVISDKVKAALAEVIKRKQALAKWSPPSGPSSSSRSSTIDQEQARIRQNMARWTAPATSTSGT